MHKLKILKPTQKFTSSRLQFHSSEFTLCSLGFSFSEHKIFLKSPFLARSSCHVPFPLKFLVCLTTEDSRSKSETGDTNQPRKRNK